MNESLRMHVVNPLTNLNQYMPDKLKINACLRFLNRDILLQIAYVSVKIATVSIFEAEHKTTVLHLLSVHKVHIVQFDNIRVIS